MLTEARQRFQALAEMPAVQAVKPADERPNARASSTDPEARVMKMADGGYRPAYNWEFAVDTAHRVITGVEVVNVGSDKAQMPPMLDQVKERCARLPADWLMDGGFVSLPAIETGAATGVRLLAPVPAPKDKDRDRYAALPGDSPPIAAWRKRMGTEDARRPTSAGPPRPSASTSKRAAITPCNRCACEGGPRCCVSRGGWPSRTTCSSGCIIWPIPSRH